MNLRFVKEILQDALVILNRLDVSQKGALNVELLLSHLALLYIHEPRGERL